MKAALLIALHQPLEIVEIPQPQAQAGEVLVKLSHAALNHRDLWINKGQYAGIQLPCVPGSDGCGTVVEIGSGVSPEWVGKEVIINPGLQWGNEATHQGKHFSIIGMPTQGTLAEYMKVPVEQLFEKPQHLSAEEAAALPLAGLTAYRALMVQGKVERGHKVLVTGLGGGVAQWTAILAHAIGCEVWATSGTASKCEQALNLGIKSCLNYKENQWDTKLKELAGEFDIIIDSTCGPEFYKLTDLCKPGGKIIIYGGTAGNIAPLVPAKIFWKQISLIGSTMGSEQDFKDLCEMVSYYKIKPLVSHLFKLEQINEALSLMAQSAQFGKIIISIA